MSSRVLRIKGRLNGKNKDLEATNKALEFELEELKIELVLCKASIAKCGIRSSNTQGGRAENQRVQGQPLC